jgi:signal peptidase II
MLFFPIFDFYWPQWVPIWGGENFVFFSPVFNIADSSIFLGVVSILIFQRKFFREKEEVEVHPISTEPIVSIDHSEPSKDENRTS